MLKVVSEFRYHQKDEQNVIILENKVGLYQLQK